MDQKKNGVLAMHDSETFLRTINHLTIIFVIIRYFDSEEKLHFENDLVVIRKSEDIDIFNLYWIRKFLKTCFKFMSQYTYNETLVKIKNNVKRKINIRSVIKRPCILIFKSFFYLLLLSDFLMALL